MRKLLKQLGVAAVGLVAALYLANPGAGVFEFIPDNSPILGNIDEALATTLLIGCLGYFGIDVTRWLGRGRRTAPPSSGSQAGSV